VRAYAPRTHVTRPYRSRGIELDVPPGRGTPRRRALAHTAGVTTFDSEPAPTTTQNAAPISEGAADTRAHQHERRRKQLPASPTAAVHASMREQKSRDLLVVTAQLIEAACRARDGDSDGSRAHIARAVALLDGTSGTEDYQANQRPRPKTDPARRFRDVAVATARGARRCQPRWQNRHQGPCGVTRLERRSLLSGVQAQLRYACSNLDQTPAYRVRSRSHAHDGRLTK
jgi:hypothetical protein